MTLRVFDALGQTVEVLVNEVQPAGSYEISFDAGSLSSGVYVYQLSFENKQVSKKMNLVK